PGQTQFVSDTGKQIQQFMAANPTGFGADQLVLFWAGSQNLLQAALTGHLITGLEMVSRAIDELASELRMIDRNGARRVLLPNQIDASSAPYFADPALPPGIRSLLSVLTVDFNRQLSALLATLMSDPAFQADLYTVDMFGLVNAVENAPSAFGFDNVTVPLITDPSAVNGDRYLFWDSIHPTTQGHRLLADAAFRALPSPSTLLLVLVALGALAAFGAPRSSLPRTMAARPREFVTVKSSLNF
ncbi:MAG TPA: SGNH/GDSL hydrolase family protein, partial [Accumulibacter sp.]|nr:SGNH/GDSL hydrolase family protein [Accumulibacter sp.]